MFFFQLFPPQIICPVEPEHTPDGDNVLNDNKSTLPVI